MLPTTDVGLSNCKDQGDDDGNEMFEWAPLTASTGLLKSLMKPATARSSQHSQQHSQQNSQQHSQQRQRTGYKFGYEVEADATDSLQADSLDSLCATASAGDGTGGYIYTTDSAGDAWCLIGDGGRSEGSVSASAVPCTHAFTDRGFPLWSAQAQTGGGTYGLQVNHPQGLLGYTNALGASGPLPHTHYVKADPWGGSYSWVWDAVSDGTPSQLRPKAGAGLVDDDNVGRVGTVDSGSLCLTLTRYTDIDSGSPCLTLTRYTTILTLA
jgi:hypothetical protein